MSYPQYYTVNNIPININKITLLKYDENDIIPTNITHINFDTKYCKIFNNLPISLIKILFYSNDNLRQEISNLNNLPMSLRYMYNFYYFNKSTNNLPSNIKNLIYGYDFNKKINNLPCSIKTLSVDSHFKAKINKFPINLETLIFNKENYNRFRRVCRIQYYDHNLDNLPLSLKKLKILIEYRGTFDFLPEGLKILQLCYYENQINDLPSSIKKIVLNNYSKFNINKMYQHKIQYY